MGRLWVGLLALGLLAQSPNAGAALSTSVASSKSKVKRHFSSVDFGLFLQNAYGRYLTQSSEQNLVSHFTALVRFRRGIHLWRGFFFEPSLATLVPWYAGADGTTFTFTLFADLGFLIPIFSFLKLRVGPCVETVAIAAQAETFSLGNGTGSNPFYVPGGIRFSFLGVARLGLEARLSRKINLNADIFAQSVFNPGRRSFQAALSLGVYL